MCKRHTKMNNWNIEKSAAGYLQTCCMEISQEVHVTVDQGNQREGFRVSLGNAHDLGAQWEEGRKAVQERQKTGTKSKEDWVIWLPQCTEQMTGGLLSGKSEEGMHTEHRAPCRPDWASRLGHQVLWSRKRCSQEVSMIVFKEADCL